MTNFQGVFLKNWIPFKLINHNSGFLFQWLHVGNQPFTDPFFDDTVAKCKRRAENLKPFRCVSEINIITEWANEIDSVAPSAFIFHVSRCGSTLVSQLLAMKEENISLSEVPVFDEILRMPFKHQVDSKTAEDLLPAACTFYGQKRSGKENRLFIKTDSWHLLFYKQLRVLYPHVPFIILYRQPHEVLFSQQRQKGMHAVPGLIEPSVFGFDEKVLNVVHYDDYMSLVLQKYYQTIVEVATQDGRILLIIVIFGC